MFNNDNNQDENYRPFQGDSNSYGNFSGAYQNSNFNPTPKKPKKEKTFGKKLASSLCFGLAFGLAAGATFSVPAYYANKEMSETRAAIESLKKEIGSATTQTPSLSISPSISSSTDSIDQTLLATNNNSTVKQIATACLPSVVSITNKGVTQVQTFWGTYTQDTSSSGSGIIIGENDTELLIVTNFHVVSGSSELTVVFSYDEDSENPSVVSAKIKGYEKDKDLAVIAVSLSDITDEMRSQIKIATIGDSSALQLGEQVVAIGNALGYGQSVTTGIISALNREVSVESDDGQPITNKLIQTDAAINPGNSGGALLNMNGELVGINSVKVASSSVEGMGYAIPISDVQSIIETLMIKETRDVVSENERGYLGITQQTAQTVSSDISETYGIPVGVYLRSVLENSPAEKAGLQKGYVITKVENQTVKTYEDLKTILAYYKADETVTITAQVPGNNGYVEQNFTVTLASYSYFNNSQVSGSGNNSSQSQDNGSDNSNDSGSSKYDDFYNFFWPFGRF